jgi:hypothetical protein
MVGEIGAAPRQNAGREAQLSIEYRTNIKGRFKSPGSLWDLLHFEECRPRREPLSRLMTGTMSLPEGALALWRFNLFRLDGPAGARGFLQILVISRVRSCIRPSCATEIMVAGPDGVRGSRPHQRVALHCCA